MFLFLFFFQIQHFSGGKCKRLCRFMSVLVEDVAPDLKKCNSAFLMFFFYFFVLIEQFHGAKFKRCFLTDSVLVEDFFTLGV